MKAIGAPLQVVDSDEVLQEIASSNKVLVAGFVAKNSAEEKAITAANGEETDLTYIVVNDAAVAQSRFTRKLSYMCI